MLHDTVAVPGSIQIGEAAKLTTLSISLQEIKKLLELRERPQDACRGVSELLKTKLAKVRGTIRELNQLERELALDVKKCNRELRYSKKHAPRNCPILQVPTRSKGKA
jgi:hypothetical protein